MKERAGNGRADPGAMKGQGSSLWARVSGLLGALLLLCLALPPWTIDAACVIYLKNGSTISTPRCWEEEGKVLFTRYGGVVGLPMDLVAHVERTEGAKENEEGPPQEPAAPVPREGAAGPGPLGEPQAAPLAPRAPLPDDMDALRERRKILARDLDAALKAYTEAKVRHRKENMDKAFSTVSRLSEEIQDVRKKVIERNGGRLPAWWQEDQPAPPASSERPHGPAEGEERTDPPRP